VLVTPENWPWADSTPIIDLLDQRFPARRLFPEGLLGVLVHVVEDYLDEWVARTMVHYRWHYPESARVASLILGGGNEQAAEGVRNWGPRACRATGTETEFHQRACEAEYVRILEAAEAQLAETRFLLGDRPCAVDCVMLGGLRAHTYHDPDPRKVVERYPRVAAWAENARTWDGKGDLAPFPGSTAFARFILAETARHYLPVLRANIAALREGAKAFTADTYGEPASYLCRPYPVRAREMVQERIAHRLTEAERNTAIAWLRAEGLDEYAIAE
jgi:glutathione S-transferase